MLQELSVAEDWNVEDEEYTETSVFGERTSKIGLAVAMVVCVISFLAFTFLEFEWYHGKLGLLEDSSASER